MNVKEGIVVIASEVLEDVQKEAESLIANAEREAIKTLEKSKELADQAYLSIIKKAEATAQSEEKRIASLGDIEVRNKLLQTKEELVDKAIQKAIEKLEAFTKTDQYYNFLQKQIERVASGMNSKKLRIQVNGKDKMWLSIKKLEELSKKLEVELTIIEESPEFIGGCKIKTPDNNITYDGTIDNKIAELRLNLRSQIANMLFTETN
jgi:V/A-type H+-transporting ATPase subunit E